METIYLYVRLHYFPFSFINDKSLRKGPKRPNFSFHRWGVPRKLHHPNINLVIKSCSWFSYQDSFCPTFLNFHVALEVTLCSHEAQEGAEAAPVISPTPCLNLPSVEGKNMRSYSFPCTLESDQCMVPSCSLGPTALDALNGQSQFLQVLSHLSASEIVSLVFWKRNGPVTKSLWRLELVLQTKRRNKLNFDTKSSLIQGQMGDTIETTFHLKTTWRGLSWVMKGSPAKDQVSANPKKLNFSCFLIGNKRQSYCLTGDLATPFMEKRECPENSRKMLSFKLKYFQVLIT